MITLHPISAGSGIDYLLSTVAGDDVRIGTRELTAHWAGGGDTPGVWLGAQAAELGIAGRRVTQEAADALFKDALSPVDGSPLGRSWSRYPSAEELYERYAAAEPQATEERLLQLRAKAEKEGNRTARCGWEMVFSPVKSFSVLWGCADDEERARLEAVEERAFRRVFERVEREACITRTGPTPASQVQVRARGFIACVFVHRSSRAADPAYHWHLAISSKVRVEDGRWLALDARHLHRIAVALSEAYTAELEREMHAEFGIRAGARQDSIRPAKRPVREFLGVPLSAVRGFSQRREATERALARMIAQFTVREGRAPERAEQYKLAQAATLESRPAKTATTVDGERRQWRRRAKAYGIRRPDKLLRAAARTSATHPAPGPDPMVVPKAIDAVLAELESHRATWTRANVEAEACRRLTALGAHLFDDYHRVLVRVVDGVLSPVRCELLTPPDAVPLPARYARSDDRPSLFAEIGARVWTSHGIRAAERSLAEASTTPVPVHRLTTGQVDRVLAAGEAGRGFAPSDEQREAVRRIFGADTRATWVVGPAGTGKTTIMRLVREVAQAHGIPVIGLAGGQVQADLLAAEAGIRAENIARWRTMSERYGRGLRHWTLQPGTIVIVDESGQASTTDLAALLGQVRQAGGRLLPIGDPRQLGSPGAGGALADIEETVPGAVVRLTEVRRFRDPGGRVRQWEVDAARLLSVGDAGDAFDAYDLRGRIHSGPAAPVMRQLFEDWRRDVEDGLTSVMIAATGAAVAELSRLAREDRIARGLVDDRRTADLGDRGRVGAGDIVVTRVNDRRLATADRRQWVRNGDTWSVEAVGADGSLTVRHQRTRRTVTLPPAYVADAVDLGYAITSARCQGVTVDVGRALLDTGWNRNGAYPALTRGRYGNHAYLVTQEPPDEDSGEPGHPHTAREIWHAVVERDGTQLSASATARRQEERAQSLATSTSRLVHVLDELNAEAAQQAVAALLGGRAAARLAAAEAWPALRARCACLADDGYDTDRLLRAVWADERGNETDHRTGRPLRDLAAIVVARLDALVEHHGESFRLPEGAPRPATAPTYWARPSARPGAALLEAMGLVLPDADPGDRRVTLAHDLAAHATVRAERLAARARANAHTGTGWAAAYGPEPADADRARPWAVRIAAAAAWRDLAGFRATRATGDAPTAVRTEQRGLWRAAQLLPDEQQHAAELAATGPTWLDVLGPAPAPAHPHRPLWDRAAALVAAYRGLWDHGHETQALGDRPEEPIQAADHDLAREAVTAWQNRPAPTVVDEEQRWWATARGRAARIEAAEAADALAAVHAARRLAARAQQQADDERVRAAAAGPTAATDDQRARASALRTRADAHTVLAGRAADALAAAERRLARTAPNGLRARAEADRCRAVEQLPARQPADRPDRQRLVPAGAPAWRGRPFGGWSDAELDAALRHALDRAARQDEAAADAEDRATRAEARMLAGGRIDRQVRALVARVTGAARLRAADAVLADLTRRRAHLAAELAAADPSGRPAFPGGEREDLVELRRTRQAEFEALLQAEHHHRLLRAQALADIGDLAGVEAALDLWARVGGSAEAYRDHLRRIADQDARHHHRTAHEYRDRAARLRVRVGALREEQQARTAMPAGERAREAAERLPAVRRRRAKKRETAVRRQAGLSRPQAVHRCGQRLPHDGVPPSYRP
ncbi:MobF family relaxase [Kitasatospora sp. NPDC001261]|uniref:MobF family relaxase n=1 Tax=Kitasatospora sp. NPDC001261 TaxID=3364012 RepID=UPI003674E1A0